MDLAVAVGWPREAVKWSLLFDVGPGFGVDSDRGGLAAMVMIPSFADLSFVAMMVVHPDMQGLGLGRRPLEHTLSALKTPAALYAMRWWNGHLRVVGPIVAADEVQAIRLFDRVIVGSHGPARIDVSRRCAGLISHVEGRGLAGIDRPPLMTHPKPWAVGERDRYFAIALQAFG